MLLEHNSRVVNNKAKNSTKCISPSLEVNLWRIGNLIMRGGDESVSLPNNQGSPISILDAVRLLNNLFLSNYNKKILSCLTTNRASIKVHQQNESDQINAHNQEYSPKV